MQQVRAIHLILILRCRLLSCPLTKWRKPWAPNNSIWKRLWFSVPDGKMVDKAKAICQIQQMDHSNITKTTSVRSPFGSSPKWDRKKQQFCKVVLDQNTWAAFKWIWANCTFLLISFQLDCLRKLKSIKKNQKKKTTHKQNIKYFSWLFFTAPNTKIKATNFPRSLIYLTFTKYSSCSQMQSSWYMHCSSVWAA